MPATCGQHAPCSGGVRGVQEGRRRPLPQSKVWLVPVKERYPSVLSAGMKKRTRCHEEVDRLRQQLRVQMVFSFVS